MEFERKFMGYSGQITGGQAHFDHLWDQGLSLKGKGLLSMLLSLPDTWNDSVRGLPSITPDGVDFEL